MARKDAREVAMKLFYQKGLTGEADLDYLLKIDLHSSINDKDKEYIIDLLALFEGHSREIDDCIKKFSRGWEFSRIAQIDLAILRLALCEILYRPDIPVSVSINEAVELAKKFGSDKSGKFVNGVLGGFIRSRPVVKEGQVELAEGQAPLEGKNKAEKAIPSDDKTASEQVVLGKGSRAGENMQ